MDFLNIAQPIIEKLAFFCRTMVETLKFNDLIALSFDFNDPDNAIKARWLLLTIAKIANWNIAHISEIDINNLAGWNSIVETVKETISELSYSLLFQRPSITFEQIRELYNKT